MKTKTLLIFTVLTILSIPSVYSQDWGVGLRLGDPTGITVKKYMGGNALELSVGRTHWFYGHGYYDRRFNKWYESNKFGYKDFNYIGYRASVPLGLQVHYLFQKGIASAEGLDWYVGFGGQFRFQTYTYDYRYKVEGDPDWYYSTGGRVTDFDLGVDGVIGLEYNFSEVPISLFIDATLFVELIDDPFLFWFQSGLGIRYRF